MANHLPISFSDSDNCSSVCFPDSAATPRAQNPQDAADAAALSRLSESLGSLLSSGLCADAHIYVPSASHANARKVPVHRAMLSARSPFFRERFEREKPGVKLGLVDLIKGVDVGYESLMLVLGYVYTGRVGPLHREACDCADDGCPHVACRPTVDFLLQVLYASFTFQISELVSLFQRRLVDILEKVRVDDMLVILSVAKLCDASCERLLARCIEIAISSDLDIITLEKALPQEVVKKITDSRTVLGLQSPELNSFPDKHVKRIHRALDSDDVELVRMLLKERPSTTLDDAYALHYAVAHCDSKITTELLDLGIADVNHRNPRGYTVLHVAAMRKDPKILVSLLTKGARPMEMTQDNRKAIQIARQLTRRADYHKTTEKGMVAPNDCLCIEILENAERRNPLVGEGSNFLASAGENLKSKLLYLENRVALARLLFPEEARIAMHNAKVEGTFEFTLEEDGSNSRNSQVSSVDDLNATPFILNEEQLRRMKALSKTVETGKTFFPRCSKFIDKLMDDETAEFASDISEEKLKKHERYFELQEEFQKAFCQDKEQLSPEYLSAISSSASSSPPAGRRAKYART